MANYPAAVTDANHRASTIKIIWMALPRLIGQMLLPRSIALVFCLQAVVAVLLLAILVPPFENSDEIAHFQRVDQISRGGMIGTRFYDLPYSGGRVHAGIAKVDSFIGTIRFHPDRKVDQAMLREANTVRWGEIQRTDFANTAIYPPILYLPAVIGIWIGKLAGLPIAATLELSRVFLGLFGVLMAAAAVAMAGEYALLLAIMLSMPMSLSLFGAVSQDGPMLAMAAFSVAMLRRLRDAPSRGDLSAPELWGLTGSLALLTMGRPAYAPFVVLPLLLPNIRLSLRIAASGIAAACFGLWSLCAVALAMVNTSVQRGVRPVAQLEELLEHPDRVFPILLHTLAGRQGMEGQSFFHELVGVLGWIDVVLPDWFYGFTGVVLAAAVLSSAAAGRPLLPTYRPGIAFLAAMMAVGLVFLLIYLTWTPLGYSFVDGVQGRYFLPIALLLPTCLPLRLPPARRLLIPLRLLLLGFPTVSIVMTLTAVVHRYFI